MTGGQDGQQTSKGGWGKVSVSLCRALGVLLYDAGSHGGSGRPERDLRVFHRDPVAAGRRLERGEPRGPRGARRPPGARVAKKRPSRLWSKESRVVREPAALVEVLRNCQTHDTIRRQNQEEG